MSIEIIAHDALAALHAYIEKAGKEKETLSIAAIRWKYLRPTTREAFHLLVSPVLRGMNGARIFFADAKTSYITWHGKQKSTYMQLHGICATLVQQGIDIDPSAVTAYLEPGACLREVKAAMPQIDDKFDEHDDLAEDPDEPKTMLNVGPEQAEVFKLLCSRKIHRKQLHILVVEDQIFSQKLLCDILRGVRTNNSKNMQDGPVIDTAQGVQEAWKIFLKKAPDISFIDLNLTDGSGHELVRAIKEVDAASRTIIVTANNYEEEFAIARQNNADSFITKPFNKKQILDCVANYIESRKKVGGAGTGVSHGRTG